MPGLISPFNNAQEYSNDAFEHSIDVPTQLPKDATDQSFCIEESEITKSEEAHMDVTCLDDIHQPYRNPDENSLRGKFMSLDQQIDILQDHNKFTKVSDIPKGVKENVFFVLNDEYNAKRRADGKNSSYADDCGAWMQGKNITKPEYFLKTQLG